MTTTNQLFFAIDSITRRQLTTDCDYRGRECHAATRYHDGNLVILSNFKMRRRYSRMYST